MSNRPTLKDVATRANVSLTTVSLFLNGNTQVCSRETAERIREAVETLHYHRSARPAAAAGMSGGAALGFAPSGYGASTTTLPAGQDSAGTDAPPVTGLPFVPRRTRSRTLGVAISQAHELYAPDQSTESGVTEALWHGAQQMAEWEEYGLMSFPARIRTGADFRPFLENGLAGLILSSGHNDPRPSRLAEAGVPVILLGRYLDIPEGCGAVYALETDTVELAMQHLWNKAHRRIAHYAGPVEAATAAASDTATTDENSTISYVPSDVAIRRRDRYRLWMRKNDQFDPALEFSGEENWKGEQAGIALDTWMALPEPPTAVFCASDSLAYALMEAAVARGISLPDQLSVIGVDDAGGPAPDAETGLPGLTSVSIPVEQIGREAVRLLLRMVEGVPASQCRVAIPVTRLIEGESAAER